MHSELLLDVVILILTGCLGGILSGFFGLGGGVIYVPILLTIFQHDAPGLLSDMHTAIGTSLALLILPSITSAHKHHQSGNITLEEVWKWSAFVLGGAIAGSVVMSFLSGYVLKIIFNVFVYLCIVLLLCQKEDAKKAAIKIKQAFLYFFATVVGFFSVMLGIGGGTLTVPFFKILHHSYRRAVAVSCAGGVVIGITGAVLMVFLGEHSQLRLPHYSIGYVNWLAFVCVSPLSILFANWGAKWVTHCPEKITKVLYIAVLSVSAIYMTIKIITHT